ncbi:hypothetical protein [Flavobacterium chungangense]|uniref:Uncharacterized protein n=1 Tax=Flavobacterium chungangense TaxID=554283 RepID=A0A6V6Z6X5_9FLAO|nr:hypothetical protein [Flavobacterium chungangense]CAD0007537.1 hypothetical protein FLACHUCJ7_03366 [Flavobacterium chungangense]
MDTINHITKTPLPPHQDFTFLKNEALGYIQKHIGSEWTNFNPSDPGMTILDQFCYALTELGYCTDFSIPDILTDANGDLEINNQFYLPYQILTTAPYTIDDYKKYLIDGIEEVYNVAIICYNNNIFPFNKVYQVYVYVNPEITNPNKIKNICKSAFYLLNKSRNLGELFNVPIALQPVNCWIGGKLDLKKEADPYTVLLELQAALRSYVFSKIAQTSTDNLKLAGYTSSEIYDGPYLENGWIITASLVDKKDTIQAVDLVSVIESVAGVDSISGLQLYQEQKTVALLQSTVNQILSIDILGSYQNKNLILSCNGKDLPFDSFRPLLASIDNFEETTSIISNSTGIKLPKSYFRDINTYYSIQNTFPAQYNIGDDTIEDETKPVQVAQSRQLKGYLTLFDQILANQFSQLANISKLFSFKNSVCGTPSDEEAFYAVKDKYEQKHLEYPVPYKMFSPSYYYQSLYTVPHIQPLLKDSNTFNYSYGNESQAELKEKSWIEYQQDPYNPYIFGLMKLMEQENISLDRRNKLLDHLLARHGESPKVIDSIIDDTIYTGDKRKDQIILKSLYLQNLGLLSYNRQKAYDFLSASKIASQAHGKLDTSLPKIKEKHFRLINENTSDFIFRSEQINKKEKLHLNDFNNFSGIELKLNLLFGLKNIYSNFITSQLDILKNSSEKQSDSDAFKTVQGALWFTEKRSGSILLESVLLLNQLKFNLEIIKENQVNAASYRIENIDFQTVTNLNYVLNVTDETTLDIQLQQNFLLFSDVKYFFIPSNETIENQNDYVKATRSNYSFRITIPSGNEKVTIDSKIFKKSVFLIFPDFIPPFQTAEFKKRLKQFLKINLPANVNYECLFLSCQELEEFIPDYLYWYESLRYKDELLPLKTDQESPFTDNADKNVTVNPAQSAMNLISSLTSILETKNGRN